MRIVNATPLDTEWLKAMTLAVVPSGVTRYDVTFRVARGGGARGLAHPGYREVLVKLEPDCRYPHRWGASGGYLGMIVYSVYEAAVYVTAHELRHLWQHKHPKGYRVWGARGRYSERDADAYAIQQVRRYRRGELACGLGRMARVPTSDEKAAQRAEATAQRKEKREAHVRAQVARWERKVKLAKTMLRKWTAKLNRIEKSGKP